MTKPTRPGRAQTDSSTDTEPRPRREDRPSARPQPDDGVYVISVASRLTGVPATTLRLYEDKGLLTPARTVGRTRRYSPDDIARIVRIVELSDAGINLVGIKLVLQLQDDASDLRTALDQADLANRSDRRAKAGEAAEAGEEGASAG